MTKWRFMKGRVMHGSIIPVTTPPPPPPPRPRGNHRELPDFLFQKCKFPTPGQLRKDNSPPRGQYWLLRSVYFHYQYIK
jgi:hypothetical protein